MNYSSDLLKTLNIEGFQLTYYYYYLFFLIISSPALSVLFVVTETFFRAPTAHRIPCVFYKHSKFTFSYIPKI